MRGKISDVQKSLIKKMWNTATFTVEELAAHFNRTPEAINVVLGFAEANETKAINYHTYEKLSVELDRGELKFYLPKDLTAEDVDRIVQEIYSHFEIETLVVDEEIIDIPYDSTNDRFAMMRQIIEEEALD